MLYFMNLKQTMPLKAAVQGSDTTMLNRSSLADNQRNKTKNLHSVLFLLLPEAEHLKLNMHV
jgi:hypothetical protein